MDPLLRLYPKPWQRRYGDEMSVLLGDARPDLRDRLDLVVGALDAHLHPISSPSWPVAAAAIAGLTWTFAGAVALGQPVPPDWPGYLDETLPALVAAVPLVAISAIGASTRLGDRNPATARLGRPLVALAGVVWTLLLVIATAHAGGDATLAMAATGMAGGIALIGLGLVANDDTRAGAALLVAALCLVVPATWSHVAFGVAWTALAAAMLRDPLPARRVSAARR